MPLDLWLAAWIPIVVGHLGTKHLAKAAHKTEVGFYGDTMALLIIIQYVYFFLGAMFPFKG